MWRSRYISGPAIYFLSLAVMLTLFFELWRLVMLIMLDEASSGVPLSVLARSFAEGARFDFAIASYIALPLYLLGVIPMIEISRRRWSRRLHFILLGLVTAVVFFLHLVDIPFYEFFNARLNGTALLWTDTPGFMISMVWDSYPVIGYLLLYAVILILFLYLVRALARNIFDKTTPTPVWINLCWLPLVALVLFIGARGRLEEKAPLRWGVAYFSSYDFANQLALNPTFTFLHDAVYNASHQSRTLELMDEISTADDQAITRGLLGLPPDPESERIVRPVRFENQNDDPPNVIVVIMESFGSTRIGALEHRWPHDLSPCFDSISERGWLFTNFYSNGMHTYTGLFCTLFGYPHLIGKMLLKQVVGRNHFYGLPQILHERGYATSFFTTHDPHFDNMQGFMRANGIEHVFSLFDYDPFEKLSTLGVPDHVMFERAVKELSAKNDRPFFATLLTGSNHGPWIVPDVPFERIPDTLDEAPRLNAFKYSDWALGQFLSRIEDDPAFANTLVLVTADNGVPWRARTDLDLTQFQVPLLMYNTDWPDTAGQRIDRLGSQMDIVSTVMGMVGLDYDNYTFGSDLLDSTGDGERFVHLSEWQKIGFIQGDHYHIDRLNGPSSLYNLNDPTVDRADSLALVGDKMRKNGRAIFTTAYRNAHRPL